MSRRPITGRLEPKFNPFDDDYLTEILKSTALGWAAMKQPMPDEIEDRITFRLAGRLANDPSFAELPYEVVPQYWLLGIDGQRLGRLDLRFKHRHSQRDYFAFEAKRLHVTFPSGKFSTEYPAYVGDDGMMAFLEGHYAEGLPAAGMLGYVMDGQCGKAWNGLDKRIEDQRAPLRLTQGSRLARSALSNTVENAMDGAHLGETTHSVTFYDLRLFHLLLPVEFRQRSTRLTA